jgi:hypothetical protein
VMNKQVMNMNMNKNKNMEVSLGQFNTPISTNTIGLYVNSLKNK